DATTVSMAFDHSNTDGYSIAMTVYEIQALYDAELVGGEAGLPEAGSFLEFCAIERGRQVPMPSVVATVQHWHRFLRACDGTFPSFPVDLGVPAGTFTEQTSLEEMELLDAQAANKFFRACRVAGGSFVAGLLAAMGVAAAELGGSDRYRTVIPLHTRTEPRWQWSLGWYINVAPIDFPVRGAVTFAEVLRGAEASFRQARTVGSAPLPEIAALLGYDVDPTRRDRFSMTSYIDTRMFPGSKQYDAWAAHAVGNVSFGEEATVWITRTRNRVAVSARYPDTPTARKNLTTYFDLVRSVLLEVALTGNRALRDALPTGRTASAGLDVGALSA
ncbi:MAG: acyltransferase papA2, partial [Streptosporangiaceae bacterium]|nr:acyltransferase papA2 [Streptosporangiaceae bacterium]